MRGSGLDRTLTEEILGGTHLEVVQLLQLHGLFLQVIGEDAKAAPFFQRSLEILTQLHGRGNPETFSALQSLLACLLASNQMDVVQPVFERIAEIKIEPEDSLIFGYWRNCIDIFTKFLVEKDNLSREEASLRIGRLLSNQPE